MSAIAQFFLLAAIEVGGLFGIWFLIRARVRRYLELENLLSGVRDEARALVLELNETADRNVSLVEDRIVALRDLLSEVDRRIGVERREMASREVERDVYAKLSRRRPIVPGAEAPAPRFETLVQRGEARPDARPAATPGGALRQAAAPAPTHAEASASAGATAGAETSAEAAAGAPEAPITLSLGRAEGSSGPAFQQAPTVAVRQDSIIPPKSRREEALDLYRQGFSAELIAARTGATVAEIELLVELEERRAAGRGSPA